MMSRTLLAAFAALQQAPQIPFVRTARPDTIDVFWSPIAGAHQMGISAGFRQSGVFAPQNRVAVNPCGDLRTTVVEDSIDGLATALTDSLTRHLVAGNAWFRLGCLRSVTAWPFADTLGQDEYLIAGVPERSIDAVAAWLHAATLQPRDTSALVSLGREALRFAPGRLAIAPYVRLYDVMHRLRPIAPLESGGKLGIEVAAEALRQAARQGTAPAEVARACTSLMIDLGDLASAFDCSSRALDVGSDSTWHALRLAWFAWLRGDSATGAAWFRRAAAAAHERTERVELGWHFETDHDWRDTYAVILGLALPANAGRSLQPSEIQEDRAEKLNWLALSDSAFQEWVWTNLATGRASGLWQGLDKKALARHFTSITYSGAAFRSCVADRDSLPPCAPYGASRPAGLASVSAHRYRLWDPASGNPLTLFIYRIEPDDLAVSDVNLRSVAELQLTIAQFSARTAARQDTTIAMEVPVGSDRKAPIAGSFITPAGSYQSWALSVRQSRSALRGGAYQEEQPAIDSAAVTVSDVVFGNTDRTGVNWNMGPERHIAAVPGTAVDRTSPLRIYYQLRTYRQRPDLKLELGVYRNGSTARLFSMASRMSLQVGVTELERDIDISHLAKGSYRLEVRVTDLSTTLGSRATELQLR